jgi:hypothetical protein
MAHRFNSALFLTGLAFQGLVSVAAARAENPENVLHSFVQRTGNFPVDGVTTDGKGNLYGYASYGGAPAYLGHPGATYMLSPPAAGKVRWLYTGLVGAGLPGVPVFNSTAALYGLYGAEPGGGPNTNGAIFQLAPQAGQTQWSYREIYDTGERGAGDPNPVIFGAGGVLYGTSGNGAGCALPGGGPTHVYRFTRLRPLTRKAEIGLLRPCIDSGQTISKATILRLALSLTERISTASSAAR